MKTLEKVQTQLSAGEFEFSRHALKRVVERNISDQEIRQAGVQATVIEDYPDDKYSPSCLLLGFTQPGRPLHIQVSLAETELVKIVTIYEPDSSVTSSPGSVREAVLREISHTGRDPRRSPSGRAGAELIAKSHWARG